MLQLVEGAIQSAFGVRPRLERVYLGDAVASRDPNNLLVDLGGGVYFDEATSPTESLVTVTSTGADLRAMDLCASWVWTLRDVLDRALDTTTPWVQLYYLHLVTVTQGSDVSAQLALSNAADFSGAWWSGGFDLNIGGGPDMIRDSSATGLATSAAQANCAIVQVMFHHAKGRMLSVSTDSMQSNGTFINDFTATIDAACTGALFLGYGVGRSGAGVNRVLGAGVYRTPFISVPGGYVP